MKILNIFILFVVLLSACSHKYVGAKGKSLDEKVVDTWEELDCKIIEQDEQGFSLGVQVIDISVVSGSSKLVEFYRRGSQEKKDGRTPFGVLAGIGGCIGGCYYGLHDNNIFSWDGYGYDKDRADRGCLISFVSCVTGLSIAFWGMDDRRKAAKKIPDFIKIDTVCVDSVALSEQKVRILIDNSDFKKSYYTDKDGNLELKFDEIIAGPTDVDSVFNLIIRYYELVDTVEVGRL